MDRAELHPFHSTPTATIAYASRQLVKSAAATAFVVSLLTAANVRAAWPCALIVGATRMLPFLGPLPGTALVVIAALTQGPAYALIALAVMFGYRHVEQWIGRLDALGD